MENNLIDNNHRIFWCNKCNVPLFAQKCPLCGQRTYYCSTDLRPVFEEEKRMLSRKLNVLLPADIFYNHRRLIYNGKTLLSFSAKNGGLFIRNDYSNRFNHINYNSSFDFLIKQTLKANMEALTCLENEAINFIQETYEECKRQGLEAVTIAFSGGKDSLVVSDLVRRGLPDVKPIIFFADTTLELPDTYLFIKKLQQENRWDIKITRPDVDFFEVMDYLDPPSKIMRWCCTLMKANTANKMLTNFKGKVLNFDGIRKAESQSRKKYPRIVPNPKIHKQITARPIFTWPTFAVWLYIFKYKLPINPAYYKGFSRVGCGMCPYNSTYDDVILFEFYTLKGKSDGVKSEEWRIWYDKWENFKQKIKVYAIKNSKGDPDEFFTNGYWKARKPNKKREFIITGSRKDDTLILYFTKNIPEYLPEYIKPFAPIRSSSTSTYFRSCTRNPGLIAGMIGGKELIIRFEDKQKIRLIKKQIKKAINCIGCGNCIYICPSEAISIDSGKIKIDEDKCIHCLKCITDIKCVGLDYKAKKFLIKGENECQKIDLLEEL